MEWNYSLKGRKFVFDIEKDTFTIGAESALKKLSWSFKVEYWTLKNVYEYIIVCFLQKSIGSY